MRQTSTGTWEPDPTGAPLPIDWAAFVTLALAGAAANIGSVYRILAGRPGSWEAARVREVLESTVGVEDDSLLEHRTEPVQVHLHVENILRDIGDESLDQYETADNELHDQREAAYQVALDNNADDAAADRILDDYDALADRLLAQQRQEWTSYADALTAAITDRLHDLSLSVPIHVEITADYDSATQIGETPTHHREVQTPAVSGGSTPARMRPPRYRLLKVAVGQRVLCLYQSGCETAVARAVRETADQRRRLLADTDDSREATGRERALSAEDALKAAHAEILAQRARIGERLGRIRDLEAEWTQDAVERIIIENATLKQRVRQLTTDNRTLDERLTAARSNLRFQDRRIADLEARLTEPANPTGLTPIG